MKNIHSSLFILHKCDFNIDMVWQAIEKNMQTGPIYSRFHFTQNLSHYIILELQSFLEEYANHFTPASVEEEYKERVQTVRRICKPIVQQINKWTSLEKFRDNIIAHPWREKGKFVIPLDSTYDIPRTWDEFRFLKDLVHYIHEIIKCEFPQDMDTAIWLGHSESQNVEPRFSRTEINLQVKTMLEKIIVLANEAHRDFEVKIFEYI